MDRGARRRIRIPAAILGAALVAFALERSWATLALALTALSGVHAAGRATRAAAGYGYAFGAGLAGAGIGLLWKGPSADWGFAALALAVALIGAWIAHGSAPALTATSAPERGRRSA